MIKLQDGTILRNLEEQVQYLTSYHDVNQGLAQWGIRVVGQVQYASQLPEPTHYEGEYGDAYAVGTSAPYDFYIWTRSPVLGGVPYWFNFGEISIVGPAGPRGPQGPAGTPGHSTHFYTSNSIPDVSFVEVGDLVLLTGDPVGAIYKAELKGGTKQWTYIGNIRGPQGIPGKDGATGPKGEQGPQGPMGPQGDAGGFINIYGILTNANQLPSPSDLDDLTVAYLVGTTKPYDLYIQVGENSDTSIWENTGPFNAATAVSVGGVYQNIWDADTKVDKITDTYHTRRVYAVDTNGSPVMVQLGYSNDAVNQCIPIRGPYGALYIDSAGIGKDGYGFAKGEEAINRNYADSNYVAKKSVTSEQILTMKPNGTTDSLSYNISAAQWNIVRRDGNAQIEVVETPTAPNHAASKAYVDSVAGSGGSGGGTQLYKHVIEVGEDTMGDGNVSWSNLFIIISSRSTPYDEYALSYPQDVMADAVKLTHDGYIVPEYFYYGEYFFVYYINGGMITDNSRWYTPGHLRDTVTAY